MLKGIVDFVTLLIGAEGARPENAIAFSSCVGDFKDANSMSCGSTEQGRPRRRPGAEEAPRTARESSRLKRKSTDKFNTAFGKVNSLLLNPLGCA